MTGVAIDASSIYSDLKTHNLLQSVEHTHCGVRIMLRERTRKCRIGPSYYFRQDMYFNVLWR